MTTTRKSWIPAPLVRATRAHGFQRFTLALVLAGVSGCRDRVTAHHVPGITAADALWGGGGGFCARTPGGLACWDVNKDESVRHGPTVIEGLEGVKDVALHAGEGCALDAHGVACFIPGEGQHRRLTFDSPSQLIATHGFPGLVCVLDARGVACWGGDTASPKRRPEMGKPSRLLTAVNGGTLCGVMGGVMGEVLRCYGEDMRGELRMTFRLLDVRNPTAVFAGATPMVLDDLGLRAGKLQTVKVANPFAVKDPLAASVTVLPATGEILALSPLTGLGPPRKLANRLIWPLVLDDKGVASIDQQGSGLGVTRWPSDGIPRDLWTGYKDAFFTRDGDALWERGWNNGDRIDRVVQGVSKPIAVAANVFWTCVLEEGGGVACLRSP